MNVPAPAAYWSAVTMFLAGSHDCPITQTPGLTWSYSTLKTRRQIRIPTCSNHTDADDLVEVFPARQIAISFELAIQ